MSTPGPTAADADSGVLAESGALALTGVTDSGASSPVSLVSAAVSGSDSGGASSSGVEGASASDSGTAAEAVVVSPAVAGVDSGSSSESASVRVVSGDLGPTDSATVSSVGAISSALADTDSGAATEGSTFSWTATDSGTATPAAQVAQEHADVDAGVGSESVSIAADLLCELPVDATDPGAFPGVDYATGSDVATVSPLVVSSVTGTTSHFNKWVFVDPGGQLSQYEFEVNPNKMTDPTLKKNTTSLGISPITSVSRGARKDRLAPRQWSFSGITRSQAQQDAFLAWFALDRKVWLRDHFGRVWLVRLTKYDVQPRKPSATNTLWRMQYTFTANVYQRIS